MKPLLPILAVVALTVSLADAQSQVKKSTIPGITNFSQVETTVACAGATTPGSVAGIKKELVCSSRARDSEKVESNHTSPLTGSCVQLTGATETSGVALRE